ncbi:protein phosphatase 2C 57 [Cinnamomum micranthum f. kanehirae]|uniref:protein-serine/threonine phosphatase n=1 Tax=Cinnamomum micranthum f. kanehirae TaxID=337451 RepID=A0A3S3NXK9_9MAGN|nr:protein phosphatase 2C 57 [Cinnamomum micranthum f. kanehirae]
MALPCKFLFSSATCSTTNTRRHKNNHRCCSAIAIDSPSSVGGVVGIRWGSTQLQGPREEMEDDVVLRSDSLNGFSFAAVFDGHGGFSSVKFLRDELYKECLAALQGGLLLSSRDFSVIRDAIQKAFVETDSKLSNWLEETCKEDESGSTATVIFLGENVLIISHVGDSCVVISRSGKAEVLTSPHRPYGNNKVSLEEIRRIRQAGGWIVNGRICGDISISRAFGDVRFKTKKNEMLEKGVEDGRWTKKFVSRIQFNGDLLTATPDIYQVALGSDAEFILLASDGLWDYMSSSDAVTFVRNQLRQHGDVQVACEALAQAALDRGSQDNISIVIADFGRTDWQKVPQQQQNYVYEVSQAFATVGIVSLGIWMSSFLFM